jgi:hypothetical protein
MNRKRIIGIVVVIAIAFMFSWFLYVRSGQNEVIERCNDYNPKWIGMLDCYGLVSIWQPDNSGYLVENNAVPGSIIAQIDLVNPFIVENSKMYLVDITPKGGCANGEQRQYCREFQVNGQSKTYSYRSLEQVPTYLVMSDFTLA